jgi:hypothetical protein
MGVKNAAGLDISHNDVGLLRLPADFTGGKSRRNCSQNTKSDQNGVKFLHKNSPFYRGVNLSFSEPILKKPPTIAINVGFAPQSIIQSFFSGFGPKPQAAGFKPFFSYPPPRRNVCRPPLSLKRFTAFKKYGEGVPRNTKRYHGIDERISLEDYERCVRFYVQLIRNSNP